jgi:hypothetical protein
MPLFAVLPTQAPAAEEGERVRGPLFAHIRAQAERGVVPHCWIPIGAPGGNDVHDVASHAELLGALYADPAGPHPEFEVVPPARAGREVRS